ncbi:hypothetical protein HK099_006118, partial [Clydaea vesicula]
VGNIKNVMDYTSSILFADTKFLMPVFECGVGKKDFKNQKVLDNNNEQACIDFCRENFPGVPYTATNCDNCYCLSNKEYKSITKGNKSECNIKCKKKDSEFCGGENAYAISYVYNCYKVNDDPNLFRHLACTDFIVKMDQFALSDGNKCYCSVYRFGVREDAVEHTLCYKDCTGIDEQICGGKDTYSTYTEKMDDKLHCAYNFEEYDRILANKKYHKPGVWRGTLEGCAKRHNFEYESISEEL